MNATPDKQAKIDRIDVSNHAQQRYLERVGFAEYPAEAVRELLADAEPTTDDDRVSNAVAWVADEAIVVTTKGLDAVTTVLRPASGGR
jgi:hypothetical protein